MSCYGLAFLSRSLWQQKKKEDDDLHYREREEAREYSKMRMFGRPGHGAPTIDNRKKRFTEHQFDKLRNHHDQDQAQFEELRPPPVTSHRRFHDELDSSVCISKRSPI